MIEEYTRDPDIVRMVESILNEGNRLPHKAEGFRGVCYRHTIGRHDRTIFLKCPLCILAKPWIAAPNLWYQTGALAV